MSGRADFQIIKTLTSDASKTLNLSFGTKAIHPGDTVPKEDAQDVPTLSWTASSSGKRYMIICIDLDAPFPSFAVLSPALHWMQAGITVSSTGQLVSADPVIAFWAGPGPPPISGPHRYVFLLYEEPAGFDAAKYIRPKGWQIKDRIRWNLMKFEQDERLGTAVAATFFYSN